jgi:hypothetical protein
MRKLIGSVIVGCAAYCKANTALGGAFCTVSTDPTTGTISCVRFGAC